MDEEQYKAREAFYEAIENQAWDLVTTLKNMRKIAGLTQAEYAKFVGVAPRIIIDIERGVGNPTLASLEKIARPFGLKVMFGKKR